jgi:hypothetical protein
MDEKQAQAFEQAANRPRPGVAGEFFLFLKENKKYWLIPLIAGLLGIGLLALLGGTAAAPFIYSLF